MKAIKPSAIEKFVEAINDSPELTRECTKVLEGSRDPKNFVKLGAKHGYKFTQAQARSYFRDIAGVASARAVSQQQLKAVVGAKVESFVAPRDDRLANVVSMLRSMSFKKPPTWTVFTFPTSDKRR
jgi:hypothetical protein